MSDKTQAPTNSLIATVKEALASVGWSESQLSRAAGVSQPTINRFLAGKRGLSEDARGKMLAAIEAEMLRNNEALEAELAAKKKGADELSGYANLIALQNYGTAPSSPSLPLSPSRKVARAVLASSLAYISKHEEELPEAVVKVATDRLIQQHDAMLELMLAGQDSSAEVCRVLGVYIARLEVCYAQFEQRIVELEKELAVKRRR